MTERHSSTAFCLAILLAASIGADKVCAQPAARTCTSSDSELKALALELDHEDTAAASQRLARLAPRDADCPALLLAKARILAMTGPPEDAGRAFSRYADTAPDDAAGMAYFARFLIDQNQYSQADEFSAAALERAPNLAIALAVRGRILALKGQSQQGIPLLSRSCDLDPEDAESEFQLGALYDRAKRPQEAVQRFQSAARLNPANASAWDYLALNAEPLGEMDQAEAAYKAGLQVNKTGPHYDAFLDYNFGRFLARRNRLAESKQHLDRAVELVPDFRATWYDRAKVNLRLGDLKQARSDAERALSITDQTGGILNLQVYVLLEQIYRRLGEIALADKYAALARDTPPPVRRGSESVPTQ